jgi:hypothetical protein
MCRIYVIPLFNVYNRNSLLVPWTSEVTHRNFWRMYVRHPISRDKFSCQNYVKVETVTAKFDWKEVGLYAVTFSEENSHAHLMMNVDWQDNTPICVKVRINAISISQALRCYPPHSVQAHADPCLVDVGQHRCRSFVGASIDWGNALHCNIEDLPFFSAIFLYY